MKIYGHEKQIQVVREAASSGRLAHSYLFYGMEGIGKKLLALELARAIICPVSAPSACGTCASCKKAINGNHPDIFVFTAQTPSIKIDDIRMLQEKSALRPFEATRKFFIVDDVDRMTREAANAFLKTLEEPSPSSIFFLITSRYHSLLPTVLSRCQKINFSPLSKETLASFLISEEGCDKETALMVASLAGGSVLLAKDILSDDFIASRSLLLRALRRLLLEREMGVFGFVKALGSDKQEAQKNLDVVKSVFRDAALFRVQENGEGIINDDGREIIEYIAQRFPLTVCVDICRIVDWALKALGFNANRQILLETMSYKIIGVMR